MAVNSGRGDEYKIKTRDGALVCKDHLTRRAQAEATPSGQHMLHAGLDQGELS
jgi:L-asparaginase II